MKENIIQLAIIAAYIVVMALFWGMASIDDKAEKPRKYEHPKGMSEKEMGTDRRKKKSRARRKLTK